MGILRTDKISGLETPTAVTGSVFFDGNNDYLQITDSSAFAYGTGDFTWEVWAWLESTSDRGYIFDHGSDEGALNFTNTTPPKIVYYNSTTGSGGSLYNDIGDASRDSWNHIAVVRNSGVTKVFVNGKEKASQADTHNYNTTTLTIGMYGGDVGTPGDANWWDGYISNVRILKGRALYTADFTPPVHALEPIDGTVLLCCNNSDSAGAASNAGIGTAHVVSVNSATVSTFSPGLTRDFTFGTEFRGVTTFDTQAYFVPPSGTTEQRGAGRAIFAGGYVGPTQTAFIESVNINSFGNTTKFGTLKGNHVPTSTSSATRQIIAGGYSAPVPVDNIDFITIATSGDSIDFGTLGTARRDFAGLSNNTRSVFGGGTTTGSTSITTNMEYVTSASLGSSSPFGSLTVGGRSNAACASPTRGMFFGGYQAYASPVSTYTNVINYITIATAGDGTDFGDLAANNNGRKGGHAAFSSSTRGVVGGGAIYGPDSPAYTPYNTIEYVTIASTGNAQDFGDLTGVNNYLSGTSNSTRGIFNQGSSPANLNTIQYVTIASAGNAQDFGDAIYASFTFNNSSSDSHGGLS